MTEEKVFKCVVCEEDSTQVYEGYPVCNNMSCGYEIQLSLDYTADAGDR